MVHVRLYLAQCSARGPVPGPSPAHRSASLEHRMPADLILCPPVLRTDAQPSVSRLALSPVCHAGDTVLGKHRQLPRLARAAGLPMRRSLLQAECTALAPTSWPTR